MYNEETQDEMVAFMTDQLKFPQGRMVYGAKYINCLLETQEDGPFWYGDLTIDELDQIERLSTSFGKEIIIKSIDEI